MNTDIDIYVMPEGVSRPEDRKDHYNKADGRPMLEHRGYSTGPKAGTDSWALTYDSRFPDEYELGACADEDEALHLARIHLASLDEPGPIEVWLRQTNMKVACTIVHEDETTQDLDVYSLSMRGAQREITGYLIGEAFTPVGRWEDETGSGLEAVRRFKDQRRFIPPRLSRAKPNTDRGV